MKLTRREFLRSIPGTIIGLLLKTQHKPTNENLWSFPLAFPARFLTPDELLADIQQNHTYYFPIVTNG